MEHEATNCIFCKIIKGELPSTKVYEDDTIIAIQALYQSAKGHTLVIPKEHKINILENDPKLGTNILETVQKIGNAIITGLGAEGFNIMINVNEAAGQEIFHTHIHLIPRWEDDGLKLWKQEQTTEEERLLAAQKIINELE